MPLLALARGEISDSEVPFNGNLFLRISVASCASSSRCTYHVLLKQNPQAWEISRGNGMLLGSDRVPQAVLR